MACYGTRLSYMRQNTTASNLIIIKKLQEIFARFKLPKICVMNNGPQLSRTKVCGVPVEKRSKMCPDPKLSSSQQRPSRIYGWKIQASHQEDDS